MGFLGIVFAKIVFGHVREDAQWFLLAGFNQFHPGMILPRAERVFGFLRCVVVLLINECAGISNDAAEQVWPEPAHR